MICWNHFTRELPDGKFRVIAEMFEDGKLEREMELFWPLEDQGVADRMAMMMNNEAMECGDHIALHSDENGAPCVTPKKQPGRVAGLKEEGAA